MENVYVLDITLTAKPILGGYTQQLNGVSITEKTTQCLVSVACPNGGDAALQASVQTAFGIDLPAISRIATSGTTLFFGLQPQQWFVVFENNSASAPATTIKDQLGDNAYCTDQSDSWVTLELTGPNALHALERICPVDLRPDIFTVGSVARTTMEHLGVIIARVGEDQYWLMSASSSAESFLHAITLSVNNIGSD